MLMCTEMDQTQEATVQDLINNFVLENSDVFEIDGDSLLCKVCNTLVSSDNMSCLDEHLSTEKHIENCKDMTGVKEESTKRVSNTELLNKYVLENKDVLETDGRELFCKICKKSISFDTKYLVYRHLKTKKHQTFVDMGNEVENKKQRDKELIAELLNKYVTEYNEVFETDGELLLCKVCKKSVSFDKKCSVDNHLKTQKHKFKYAEIFGKVPRDCDAKHFGKVKGGSSVLQKNEDFCRTCMKQFSETKQKDNKQSIMEIPKSSQNRISLMKMLENIQPQIKVEINDNLPSLMCSECIQKLLTSYEFIEMYQNVDKKLRKMLEECDMNNDYKDLDEQQAFVEEMVDFDENNYNIEIEQIHVDVFEKEIDERINDCIELKDEPKEELSDNAENNGTFSNSGSEDEWVPERNCLDVSINHSNSDDTSKKVYNGFFQPEENEDGSITCQICETVLEGVLHWRKHIRQNHSKEKPKRAYKRKKRNSKSSDLEGYTSDEATKKVFKGFFQPEANDDGSLTCQLCQSVVDGVVLWREHMRQNHLKENPKRAYNKRSNEPRKPGTSYIPKKPPPKEDGLYHCEFCGKTYPKFVFYRRHLRVHTGEPHLCVQCGKSFSLLSSYASHMLRHKGEKTFQCPHCPKSFVCKSGLYNHAITHTDNKPFVCDICGSAFHMAYQLKKHNRYHIGLKKYKCEYCDMRFVTGEKQRRHMRTHTGEKPYRCKYCERAFAQSNDCIKHLRQHLGDNVYQCDLCPLRFPLLRELRAHFTSHKNDDEETRTRNLQDRMEAEKNLQIKLGCKESTEVLT